MSVSNPNLSVSRQDLADFYDKIFPYLGGKAAAGFTPVGTVISIMGVTAPANYLACDGTVYNISDYPELATYFGQQFSMINKFGGNGTTTFAVPDLQGEFLRGTGSNSHENQGSGAGVGVHQNSTQISKWAVWDNTAIGICGKNATNDTAYTSVDSDVNSGTTTKVWKKVNISGTAATGGTDQFTIRPTNTSVLWCIATKNIYMNPSLDYSTDEKVVGSWITGKPLYQKTIQGTLTANITQFNHNISNLDEVVNIWGMSRDSTTTGDGNYQRPLSSAYYATSDWDCNICSRNTQIIICAGNNYLAAHHTVYVTMQYTKTID